MKPFMTKAGYGIVAAIIRDIDEPAVKTAIADHFATEFSRRSRSFDHQAWFRATGGKAAPKPPKTKENERPWTDEETAILQSQWLDHSVEWFAQQFARSTNSIVGKAHRLGLYGRSEPSRPRIIQAAL